MSKQSGWASCPRCQGLHFAGFPDGKGVCPAGGPHQQGNSFVYEVDFDVPSDAQTQHGWASCPKCQGLHFAGFPDFKGVCPAGGPHQQDGSFAYALPFGIAPPAGTQGEWRSCAKCQGLFFGPFGGVCPAGGRHSDTGSFNYVLTVGAHPFIALRAVRDDQGRFVEVTGRGFTPNGSVRIGYLFKAADGQTSSSATKDVPSSADGDLGRVRLPVTLGDLHYAAVEATDTASGRATTAELEAP